jgi:hypothetical protein
MSEFSALLFASPSFFEGVGRTIDLGGTLTEFNRSATPELADAIALASDWRAVGQDLSNAMNQADGQAPQP